MTATTRAPLVAADVSLVLQQPTTVGVAARSDFLRATHRHIPGSVVRGAFAGAWLARHGSVPAEGRRRDEFVALFEGGVRFGPLTAGVGYRPLSVVAHKYGPNDGCTITEVDLALDPNHDGRCPDCGARLEPKPGLVDTVAVSRRISVAIGRDGVARPGELFARDTLQRGQTFLGELIADTSDLLDALTDLGPLRLGGRRTTHGGARPRIASRPAGSEESVEVRADGCLVLRLAGPAVLVDDEGRPRDRPSDGELERLLGVPASVEQCWSRWERVGGWHAASGLPKPDEAAVAAGTTFVVRTGAAVGEDVLARLRQRGLGLRRHEGFGHLAGVYRAPESEYARKRRIEKTGSRYLQVLVLARTPEAEAALLHRLRATATGDETALAELRRIATGAAASSVPETSAAASLLLDLLDQPTDVINAVIALRNGPACTSP